MANIRSLGLSAILFFAAALLLLASSAEAAKGPKITHKVSKTLPELLRDASPEGFKQHSDNGNMG